LYVQGTPASHVYFMQRGTVSLHRMCGEDRALGKTRALRSRNAFLGLETLIAPDYSDSVRAETNIRLCVATKERFARWVGDRGAASFVVLETVLSSEEDAVLSKSSSDGTALQRVAGWILDRDSMDHTTQVPRTVLAELLGMRPETLSRALHTLQDEGLIDVTRRGLYTLDPGGLRRKLRN
jgi:CRP-like cAMP-binding protein